MVFTSGRYPREFGSAKSSDPILMRMLRWTSVTEDGDHQERGLQDAFIVSYSAKQPAGPYDNKEVVPVFKSDRL